MNSTIPIALVLTVLVVLLLIVNTSLSVITSFGQPNNISSDSISNFSTFPTTKTNKLQNPQNDTIRPSVNITYPEYPPTVTTGKIIIQGTANDSGSGIRNVSADVHTFPFNGHFTIPLASRPISELPSNWSHWSVPLIINKTDSYRVVITAIDNAGNANYAETTINAPLEKNNSRTLKETVPKIAFVRPTFTEAAYQEHGFYRFYFKYGFPPIGKNITTDLDMLTVKTPKSVPEYRANDIKHLSNITSLVPVNGTELRDVSLNYFPVPQRFWLPLIDNVKKVAPNSTVTVMRDEDVHDSHIFYPNDNKINTYDVLFLFHNEYVTQKEYDNLRQFVKNGGTIVFIDANALFAEVRYDRGNHTVTLVKGHDWQFDGGAATRSVPERWYNETKGWVGGNYLLDYIRNKVTFLNNPFNYTHFEEQYVNNPRDKIILDYNIKFSPSGYFKDPSLFRKQVASYVLEYGKGKVVMLGLTGRNLANNQEFTKFFRNAILPNTLCPKFLSCQLVNASNDYTPPLINITSPAYPPTITTSKIIIEGVAKDTNSGIANISALVGSFPFEDKNQARVIFQSAASSYINWSRWSVPLIINHTGVYRVVITALDNAGNANQAETTINAFLSEKNNDTKTKDTMIKAAFVRPTFTEAANQQHGFFDFFLKHGFPPLGKNITADIDMLTVKTPKSVSEFPGNDIKHLSNITSLVPINGTELPDALRTYFPNPQRFWLPFINNVKNAVPNATATVMRDEDVHDGNIFYKDNKTNAYDILLLFHNQYVTQTEYDNLKQFVRNGGTIVFIDSNIFRAEVSYDRDNDTITLVKGHDWKFDGKVASRSVPERWYNETKKWVGSNFLDIDANVTFANNPFNYNHSEEQFVNNPNVTILADNDIKFPKEFILLYSKKEKLPAELQREDIPIENITVATYSMDYGKGKVIMLGLSGDLLANDPEFMEFFDNTVLQRAVCSNFQSCTNHTTTNYLYGCTNYVQDFHCDPISNKFISYGAHANFTKITSATRIPSYAESKSESGIRISAHSRDSLRANVIEVYNTKQFSIYLSFKPGKYDKSIRNPYVTLASYRNGLNINDRNTAGWNIELIPNNSTFMKTVRFSVFNTNGSSLSSRDVDVPIGKFSEIVGTFDGRSIRIFVNGILESETPFTGIYSGKVDHNNFLKLAGEPYCFCYGLNDNSILNEVRYYNYSLESREVKQINNPSHDLLGNGLVGYWKLDGDLKDYSGFKNDMFYNTLIASMAFAPDGRLFYTEKNSGNIRVMVNNTVIDVPFASIPNVYVDWEQGLLGLAIDSKFKENHFVYVYYNYKDTDTAKIYAKIVRFTDSYNKGKDQVVILDKIPASKGFHTGGALAFNKIDDKLYVTVGDATQSVNCGNLPNSIGEICPAQDRTSVLGKVLRINRDGSIPKDNPFPNSPVYNYGHRNMFGIAFDDHGHGIVTEAGEYFYDEINSLIKGGNYGWPTLQQANTAPNPLSTDSSIKPLRSYYISLPPTQAAYYNGDKFPDLKGHFIVGSFRGDLYAYKISEDGKKLLQEIKLNTTAYPSKGVVGTAVSPNGEIYFGAYDIFRLDKIDFTHKEEMVIPVEIRAVNVNVSNVNYSEHTKGITLNLTKRNDLSTISIKVPSLSIEGIQGRYECNSKNNPSQSNHANIAAHNHLDVQLFENYVIMKVQLMADAPDSPQISIDKNGCVMN